MDIKFCPYCGRENIEDAGAVFIEDGPYDGKAYANEGEFSRYHCIDCDGHFGEMPKPVRCGECGERADSEAVEREDGGWLCTDCQSK